MFKLRRKLIPLLLALFIFNSTYAQSEKIDLSIKNESLRQLIKQIETKTDYSFISRFCFLDACCHSVLPAVFVYCLHYASFCNFFVSVSRAFK